MTRRGASLTCPRTYPSCASQSLICIRSGAPRRSPGLCEGREQQGRERAESEEQQRRRSDGGGRRWTSRCAGRAGIGARSDFPRRGWLNRALIADLARPLPEANQRSSILSSSSPSHLQLNLTFERRCANMGSERVAGKKIPAHRRAEREDSQINEVLLTLVWHHPHYHSVVSYLSFLQ
ncbi:hypothetical protein OH77DRAFT_150545 [Trametes cingulata]|nr:hypothetical protein OH77DRAFT_150545 [Trametes cingulata]